MIDILMSNDPNRASMLASQGWCPVECAFGDISVIDELMMDHHGRHSHLEFVAVRAMRDHAGARAADPRFLLAGVADADASFAIAALSGMLPKDDPGLLDLAQTIATMDTDPIGRDLLSLPRGETLQCWNALYGGGTDRLSALAAVDGWRRLTGTCASRMRPFMRAAAETASARRAQAAEDLRKCGCRDGGLLVVDKARSPCFDVWYGRIGVENTHLPSSWASPLVLSRVANGAVSVSCPNVSVAEALFGKGGLLNVYPRLSPKGWGGRESIGGSPRGLAMDDRALGAAASALNALIASNSHVPPNMGLEA